MTTLEIVSAMFAACKASQKFLTDKALVIQAKSASDLKETLVSFAKSQKFDEDGRILYNWFLAVAFGTCANELSI